MSSSPSSLVRSVVSIILGTVLAGGMPAVTHAGPGAENFEEAMARAGALSEQEDHNGALEGFEAAFEAMPREIQVGSVGEFVAYNGGRSAIRVFNATGEPAVLKRGKALLTSFVSAVEGANESMPKASTDRALSTLSVIEGLLEGSSGSRSEDPAMTAQAEPPGQDESAAHIELPRRRSKLDRLGLGLTITGGLLAVGGIATIIAGTRQMPWYESELDRFGWDPDATDYDYEAKLDEARRMRNIDIGLGVGLAAVGVGLLVYGVFRLDDSGRPGQERARKSSRMLGLSARGHLRSGSLNLRF